MCGPKKGLFTAVQTFQQAYTKEFMQNYSGEYECPGCWSSTSHNTPPLLVLSLHSRYTRHWELEVDSGSDATYQSWASSSPIHVKYATVASHRVYLESSWVTFKLLYLIHALGVEGPLWKMWKSLLVTFLRICAGFSYLQGLKDYTQIKLSPEA